MREIKFQYTVKKPNRYVFSETFSLKDIESGYYTSWLKNNSVGITSEIFKRQFTGLKDKNNKEIYEGDIVECCSGYGGIFKAEVVFQDGCFEIQEPQGKEGVFRDYLKYLTCNHAVSVIGNVYENPELLTAASACK